MVSICSPLRYRLHVAIIIVLVSSEDLIMIYLGVPRQAAQSVSFLIWGRVYCLYLNNVWYVGLVYVTGSGSITFSYS